MTIETQLLNEILIGKTHSMNRGETGMAHLFFKNDKIAFLKRGDEATMRGEWEYSANGFNVAWQNGPSREWILKLNNDELEFSLDGVGVVGVSDDWRDGDVQLLEAEYEQGAA